MAYLELLALLIGLHALADYPLQGDFLSRAKNRHAALPGVPWYQALGAHGAIHGLMVGLATGVWWLGLAEAVAHVVIDDRKCAGELTFNEDQVLHVAFKVVWAGAALLLT